MKKIVLAFFVLTTLACNNIAQPKKVTGAYFDVKTYFKKEAQRLQAKNPLITKTVSKNGISETKKLKITNWQREFKSFTDADINKTAWQKAFKVTTTNEITCYSNTSDKIPVKKLIVAKQNHAIVYITAIVSHSNLLYTSTDTLSYYPDKGYQINKTQKIKLMSQNNYKVSGNFK